MATPFLLQSIRACLQHTSSHHLPLAAPLLVRIRPSSSSSSSPSGARQSKILRKLVGGKDKAKRRWYQDTPTAPKLQSAASLSNAAHQGKNAPRRVHVLNKLFMKHITDLLSTGETADAIVGHGLLISHVKVSADFNYVNVFWSKSSTSSATAASTTASSAAAAAVVADETTTTTTTVIASVDLEKRLRYVAGLLRHDLSQLRLMGEVPRINFVRNRQHFADGALDELLARADFGPDYEPTAWTQLRQDIRSSLTGAAATAASLQDQRAQQLMPAMRHDVLGLNQSEIMHKIQQSMVKSRQAWQRYEEKRTEAAATTAAAALHAETVDNRDANESSPLLSSVTERVAQMNEETRMRNEEFAKFLEQRRYTRRHRIVRKNPDFREPYYKPDNDDDDDNVDDERDYIEEDDDVDERPLR